MLPLPQLADGAKPMSTSTATLERPAVPAPAGGHVHHWLIDEANGPESEGRCKKCGEVRAFKNWLEATDFLT